MLPIKQNWKTIQCCASPDKVLVCGKKNRDGMRAGHNIAGHVNGLKYFRPKVYQFWTRPKHMREIGRWLVASFTSVSNIGIEF